MTHEITIKIPFSEISMVIDKLNENNFYNIYYDLPIEITKVDSGFDYEEKREELIELKIYLDNNAPLSKEASINLISEVTNIEKKDIVHREYNEEYDFILDDIDLGNGWVISYSQNDYPDKNIIKFDPHTAFGTGQHKTTQACLRIISNHNFAGLRVADLGTGSGILSVGAAIRGAASVDAIDIDPVKKEIEHNAQLNNISVINIIQADLLEGSYRVDNTVDWAFMNIGANESLQIIDRHKLFEGNIKNFILSGLVEWNYHRVMAKFLENGYKNIEESHDNDWVTVLFKK